jgi:hypothetical protein
MAASVTTFRPDPAQWQVQHVTGSQNIDGYAPGANVSVHCARGDRRLLVTTAVGSARFPERYLALSACRRHLDGGGGLPIRVDALRAHLLVDGADVVFSGARCAQEWAIEASVAGYSVTVEGTRVEPHELRLITAPTPEATSRPDRSPGTHPRLR